MDLGLTRQDLKMVAVLAVPLPDDTSSDSNHMSRTMSFSSIVKEGESSSDVQADSEDWVIPTDDNMERELTERVTNNSSKHSITEKTPPGTPILRRIPLYPTTARKTSNKSHHPRITMCSLTQKRTVLVHSEKDLNPLRPCGACNEWLKKISESNPYFSVVTFTDAECAGVYVTPCQE